MALFWLNYRQGTVFEGVAIIESDTLISARMKASSKNIDSGRLSPKAMRSTPTRRLRTVASGD